MSRLAKYVAVLMFACVGAYSQDTLSISTFDLDSAAVRSLRFLDVTGLTVSAIPAGRYLVPGDSTLTHNWVVVQLAGKQASGTYLIPSDSTLTHNWAVAQLAGKQAAGTYLIPADSTATHNWAVVQLAGKQASGTYLIPSDSTLTHNWAVAQLAGKQASGTYLVPGDSTLTHNWAVVQLAGKQAAGSYQTLDADLTALAGLAATAGTLRRTGADAFSVTASDTVGLGTALAGKQAAGSYQTLDADLTALAGLAATAGTLRRTGADAFSVTASDTVGLGTSLAAKAALTAVLKNADSTAIRNYDNVLYAAKATFPTAIGIACSDETTALTASTSVAKVTFRMPYAMTVTAVRASVTTAPTGSTMLVDIHESGTTILSTKIMIDASEYTSQTAATPYVISDAALADDAQITVYADQVGSTIAGAGLKVWLIGTRVAP